MEPKERRSSRSVWRTQYDEFRATLVRAREEAGLTQRAAAHALRRTQSFVAKSETGERRVDVIELAQFAGLYQRPITYFLPPSIGVGAERGAANRGTA